MLRKRRKLSGATAHDHGQLVARALERLLRRLAARDVDKNVDGAEKLAVITHEGRRMRHRHDALAVRALEDDLLPVVRQSFLEHARHPRSIAFDRVAVDRISLERPAEAIHTGIKPRRTTPALDGPRIAVSDDAVHNG